MKTFDMERDVVPKTASSSEEIDIGYNCRLSFIFLSMMYVVFLIIGLITTEQDKVHYEITISEMIGNEPLLKLWYLAIVVVYSSVLTLIGLYVRLEANLCINETKQRSFRAVPVMHFIMIVSLFGIGAFNVTMTSNGENNVHIVLAAMLFLASFIQSSILFASRRLVLLGKNVDRTKIRGKQTNRSVTNTTYKLNFAYLIVFAVLGIIFVATRIGVIEWFLIALVISELYFVSKDTVNTKLYLAI